MQNFKTIYKNEKDDTKKLKHLHNICHSFNVQGDFDNYHRWLEKGIALSIKNKNLKYQINFTNSFVFVSSFPRKFLEFSGPKKSLVFAGIILLPKFQYFNISRI